MRTFLSTESGVSRDTARLNGPFAFLSGNELSGHVNLSRRIDECRTMKEPAYDSRKPSDFTTERQTFRASRTLLHARVHVHSPRTQKRPHESENVPLLIAAGV